MRLHIPDRQNKNSPSVKALNIAKNMDEAASGKTFR
jgi:hypothetical protein